MHSIFSIIWIIVFVLMISNVNWYHENPQLSMHGSYDEVLYVLLVVSSTGSILMKCCLVLYKQPTSLFYSHRVRVSVCPHIQRRRVCLSWTHWRMSRAGYTSGAMKAQRRRRREGGRLKELKQVSQHAIMQWQTPSSNCYCPHNRTLNAWLITKYLSIRRQKLFTCHFQWLLISNAWCVSMFFTW